LFWRKHSESDSEGLVVNTLRNSVSPGKKDPLSDHDKVSAGSNSPKLPPPEFSIRNLGTRISSMQYKPGSARSSPSPNLETIKEKPLDSPGIDGKNETENVYLRQRSYFNMSESDTSSDEEDSTSNPSEENKEVVVQSNHDSEVQEIGVESATQESFTPSPLSSALSYSSLLSSQLPQDLDADNSSATSPIRQSSMGIREKLTALETALISEMHDKDADGPHYAPESPVRTRNRLTIDIEAALAGSSRPAYGTPPSSVTSSYLQDLMSPATAKSSAPSTVVSSQSSTPIRNEMFSKTAPNPFSSSPLRRPSVYKSLESPVSELAYRESLLFAHPANMDIVKEDPHEEPLPPYQPPSTPVYTSSASASSQHEVPTPTPASAKTADSFIIAPIQVQLGKSALVEDDQRGDKRKSVVSIISSRRRSLPNLDGYGTSEHSDDVMLSESFSGSFTYLAYHTRCPLKNSYLSSWVSSRTRTGKYRHGQHLSKTRNGIANQIALRNWYVV
jgi:hypothetical protein